MKEKISGDFSSIDGITGQNGKQEFVVYKERFLVCMAFICARLSAMLPVTTMNAITEQLSVIFQQDPIIINLSVLLVLVINPFTTVPANYVLDKYGLKFGIRIGVSFCLIGV